MFISKNLLDNPGQRTASISDDNYNKALKYHQYFSDNNLWYVDEGRTISHIFFDGEQCIEVAPTYVHFTGCGLASDFQLVDVMGTRMVRHGRNLKPLLYYPMFEESGISTTLQSMLPTEKSLFNEYPNLKDYCLYNRHIGWTIDVCVNSYPIPVGISVSLHTKKFTDWFKDTYGIVSTGTKAYRRRVCALRFTAVN